MTTGHLVTHGEFPFGGNEDFDFLDDARIDFIAGLQRVEFALALGVEFLEAAFKRSDDFQDLVTDWGRVDFDVVVDRSELAEQRLGDLAVGRDDDLAGLCVDHVERDFFAQQNVGETLGEVVRQLVGLLLVLVVDLLERLLEFDGVDLVEALLGVTALGNADVLDDSNATGWHAE